MGDLIRQEYVQRIIDRCENLRHVDLHRAAGLEMPSERDGRPIIHELCHAVMGVDGQTRSMPAVHTYAFWSGFDVRQVVSLTEDYMSAPTNTAMEDFDEEAYYNEFEAAGTIDRSRQLAAIYDPHNLGKDVIALSLIYSPIDLDRIGEMMAERKSIGAKPINSLCIDNAAAHDLDTMLRFLHNAGDSLKELSLGRNWTPDGEIGHSPPLGICDLPAILEALGDPQCQLARLSLTLCFDSARNSKSLVAALREVSPASRPLALQGLNLNVVFTLSSEHGGDPAKDFPAFDLARLLVSRTKSDFRVRIRHQIRYDLAPWEDNVKFSHHSLINTAGFVRYLHR